MINSDPVPTHYRVRCGDTMETIIVRVNDALGAHMTPERFWELNPELENHNPQQCALVRIDTSDTMATSSVGPPNVIDDNDPSFYEKDPIRAVHINAPPKGGPRPNDHKNPYQGDDNSPELDPNFNPPAPAALEYPDTSEPLPDDTPENLFNPSEACGCA